MSEPGMAITEDQRSYYDCTNARRTVVRSTIEFRLLRVTLSGWQNILISMSRRHKESSLPPGRESRYCAARPIRFSAGPVNFLIRPRASARSIMRGRSSAANFRLALAARTTTCCNSKGSSRATKRWCRWCKSLFVTAMSNFDVAQVVNLRDWIEEGSQVKNLRYTE